jgi:hypothetical protein
MMQQNALHDLLIILLSNVTTLANTDTRSVKPGIILLLEIQGSPYYVDSVSSAASMCHMELMISYPPPPPRGRPGKMQYMNCQFALSDVVFTSIVCTTWLTAYVFHTTVYNFCVLQFLHLSPYLLSQLMHIR